MFKQKVVRFVFICDGVLKIQSVGGQYSHKFCFCISSFSSGVVLVWVIDGMAFAAMQC